MIFMRDNTSQISIKQLTQHNLANDCYIGLSENGLLLMKQTSQISAKAQAFNEIH